MNHPEDDPTLAEENADTAQRDDPARTGTDLEARRDLSPEPATPHRAGAIVTEFVSAIVEEAQERAIEMIQAAADGNDAGQREALASADRMRARIDDVTEELEAAAERLRKESERLAALHEQTTAAAATGRPTAALGVGEPQSLDDDGAPPDDEQHDDEGPHEVEVVHDPHEDGDASEAHDNESAVDADVEEEHGEAEADDEPEPDEPEPDEPALYAAEPEPEPTDAEVEAEIAGYHAEFAEMSDADLAFAYSRAMTAVAPESADAVYEARRLRYAGAALGEALTRPTFADVGAGPPPPEPVPRVGRRRRERAEAINTLRQACAQVIEEPGPGEPR